MIVTCQVDSLARYTTVRAILAMLTVLTEDGLQKAFLAKRVGPLIDQEAAHVLVLLLLPLVARRLRALEHLPSLVSLRSQLLVLSRCLLERLRLLRLLLLLASVVSVEVALCSQPNLTRLDPR